MSKSGLGQQPPELYFGAVAALVIVVALTSFAFHRMTERNMRLALASGNAAQIEPLLPKLRQLTEVQRAEIFLDNSARGGLIAYFEQRLNAVADAGHGLANYRQGETLLMELRNYLPDSQVVQGLTDQLRVRRNAALKRSDPLDVRSQDALAMRELLEQLASARGGPARSAGNPIPDDSRFAPQASTQGTIERPVIRKIQLPAPQSAAVFRASHTRTVPAPFVRSRTEARTRIEGVAPAVIVRAQPPVQTISVLASRAQDQDPVAQVEALKQKLIAQAQANNVEGARETLRDLSNRLPAKDPFVAKTAPNAIGAAYVRLASAAAKEGRLEVALKLAESGKEIAPSSRQVEAARERYARYVDIDEQLKERDRLSVHHIRWKISRVSKQSPDEMPAVTQRWVRDLTDRINTTQDLKLASRLSEAAQAIFPDVGQSFQAQKRVAGGTPALATTPSIP